MTRTLHVDDAVDALTDALADLAHVLTTPAGYAAIVERCGLDTDADGVAIDDVGAVAAILREVVDARVSSAIDHADYEQSFPEASDPVEVIA